MVHDAHGWWIDEAGPPPELAPLRGDVEADVLVVGGGFTGMWAAWHVLAAEPGARVVVLEADRCGFGPSGRNGGFVQSMDVSRPALVERFGAGADAVLAAARESVQAIGAFCAARASTPGTAPRRISSSPPRPPRTASAAGRSTA